MKSFLPVLIVAVLLFASDCSSRDDLGGRSNGDAVIVPSQNDNKPIQDPPSSNKVVMDATFDKLKLIGRAIVDGDVETFKANTGDDFHIVLFPKGRKSGATVISEIKNHRYADSLEFSHPRVVSNYDGSVWLQVTQILTKRNQGPKEKKMFAYFENFRDPVLREWKLIYLKEEKLP